MNLFQWVALTFLGGLLLLEVFWFLRGRTLRGPWLVRVFVWLTAAVVIAYPGITTEFANVVGITRGADLVLYVFALTFLGVTFYFYSRYVRLQRQLTEVVRHVALREARRGAETAGDTRP